MNGHDRGLFPGLDTPELPESLQGHALQRARAALRAPVPRADLWGRIRANRGWRLAWVVSVAALCTANVALGGWMTPSPERPSPSARIAQDPEIIAIVDLPPLRLAADERLGIRGESQNNRDTEDLS